MKSQWDLTFRYIAFLTVVVTILALAWYVRVIFMPLITAGVIAYLLSPIINLLAHTSRLSRKAAARIVFFAGITFIVLILFFGLPTLLTEMRDLTANLNAALDPIQATLRQPTDIGGVKISFGGLIPAMRNSISEALIIPAPEEVLLIIESTSRGFLWVLVILVSTYYLMTDWAQLREWLIGLAPTSYQNDLHHLYQQIKDVWMSYLRGQVLLMIIVGIVFSIIWAAIGLPGALVLGIITGLFSLVPEIGPLAATVMAAVVALLEGSNFLPISNFWFAALVIGIYAALINIKNVWLRPFIMGRSVNMHEGVVFLAIIAAVVTAGIMGALLIVPVLASARVIGQYIRHKILGLRSFDDLSPEENPVEYAPPDRIPLKHPRKTKKLLKVTRRLRY
jgi:predicted PurR-regulated permease PerM